MNAKTVLRTLALSLLVAATPIALAHTATQGVTFNGAYAIDTDTKPTPACGAWTFVNAWAPPGTSTPYLLHGDDFGGSVEQNQLLITRTLQDDVNYDGNCGTSTPWARNLTVQAHYEGILSYTPTLPPLPTTVQFNWRAPLLNAWAANTLAGTSGACRLLLDGGATTYWAPIDPVTRQCTIIVPGFLGTTDFVFGVGVMATNADYALSLANPAPNYLNSRLDVTAEALHRDILIATLAF